MFFIVILAHASINITLRMASINTNAVLEASKHLCKPSKSFDLQLRGQPHSGTTWLGKQVADIIYMASTYNPVGLRSYFYVHEGTDEPGMIACTYNISWREQAKHSIDGLDLQGPGLPQGIARGMDPRMVPCLHLEAEKLLEACVTPFAAQVKHSYAIGTRWLLILRNPISLCLSNAHLTRSYANTSVAFAIRMCKEDLDSLTLWVTWRYLWHTHVLPRERTFFWWYEESPASQCASLLSFLGYSRGLEVFCGPLVEARTRQATIAAEGVSRPGSKADLHLANSAGANITDLLPLNVVQSLARTFYHKLPDVMQQKWKAVLHV